MELKMFLSAIALEFDNITMADERQCDSIFDLGYALMAGPLNLRLKAKDDENGYGDRQIVL